MAARANGAGHLAREPMGLPAPGARADDRGPRAAHANASHFFPQTASYSQ